MIFTKYSDLEIEEAKSKKEIKLGLLSVTLKAHSYLNTAIIRNTLFSMHK